MLDPHFRLETDMRFIFEIPREKNLAGHRFDPMIYGSRGISVRSSEV